MVMRNVNDQTPTDTLYLGNLDGRVTRRILWDLCLQAGPVLDISLPRESDDTPKGYAFCRYASVETAAYAKELFQDLVCLFGRPVRVNFSPQGSTDT